MYEIYKLKEDLYQFHSKKTGSLVEGTQLFIILYAIQILGFNPNELEIAFVDMIQKDKDSAHFGIFKSFIFSFNREEKYGQTA